MNAVNPTYQEENGSIVPGKTLVPMSDVERNNRLLERLENILKKGIYAGAL